MTTQTLIALFVKPPVPGNVKTRLARDIGNLGACNIYCRLVEGVLRQLSACGIPLALFYHGDELSALPQHWRNQAVSCISQRGDDLGERMADAFRRLFSDGAERVVLIGSDIPGLDAAYLKKAAAKLEHFGMVIGPALDGGYCLIGFERSSFSDSIFSGIPWSTGYVMKSTLDRCKEINLSPFLLEPLRDIDTIQDLMEEAPELL